MDDLLTVRTANLIDLVAQYGGTSAISKKLKLTAPSYISQLVHGKRPVTEKAARKIESALKLPRLWLDQGRLNATESAGALDIDAGVLSNILDVLDAVAKEVGVKLSNEKFSELVTICYKLQALSDRVTDRDVITRLYRLAI